MRDGGVAAALTDVRHVPFWLDGPQPEVRPALAGATESDLLVVGGGYSGLWTALLAKEADPHRDVVLVEARTVGWAASGRNGGFCAASLTHGLRNGIARFPDEVATLERLGRDNLDAISKAVADHGIACSFERTGELTVATAPWQLEQLRGTARLDPALVLLDRDEVRARVDSPTYLGGLLDRDGVAMLDPAALARGLLDACLRLGVQVHENTEVLGLATDGATIRARTGLGSVRARRVALATNAFPPLLRRLRSYVVPVWDHVLVTEPLSSEQRSAVGWEDRHGLTDAGNQFHYYRLTDDDRVLWGGYDATYHFGGRLDEAYARRSETSLLLAEHFFATFPQLEGLRFTHAWGGAIDTCSRFCAFFGTAMDGRVGYAAGYTGLGVGATRFGAQVVLDLLAGADTERTRLSMVRTKPIPFPPEPLRWAGIELTRRAIARADRREGRRGPWLRTLDAIGLGFDS